MPNKNGTGPEGKGQHCRIPSRKPDRGGGLNRMQPPSAGRFSGAGKGSGRRQGQRRKWQRSENQ